MCNLALGTRFSRRFYEVLWEGYTDISHNVYRASKNLKKDDSIKSLSFSFRTYFALSVAFHIAALAMMVLYPHMQQRPKVQESKPPIAVTLQRSRNAPSQRASSQSPSAVKSKTAESLAKPKSLSSLGLGFPGLKNQGKTVASDGDENLLRDEGEKWVNSPGFYGGSAEKILRDTSHSLYRYIYQKIDTGLSYPVELRTEDCQGTILGSLAFDADGNFVKDKSLFKGSDPFLRVHVIRSLRQTWVDPIPKSLNHLQKSFMIKCMFQFDLTQDEDNSSARAQQWISGNHLFFYRGVFKSVLTIKGGPFTGSGMDPEWFVEKGKDMLKPKGKMDPLDKYRNDPDW